MKTEVREISPSIATEMLKKNYNNRKLSKQNVRYLSKQMKDGQWLFDGQPIRFDEFERLLDGQHRLSAVIESDTTQKFLIVSGLSGDTFKVMDTGKSRSGGDSLLVLGVRYATDVSAIAKASIRFKSGYYGDSSSRMNASNTDIVKWWEDNKSSNIEELIKKADVLKRSFSGVMTRSQVAFFMYTFNEVNVLTSELFMSKLCTGLDLDVNSPIFVLRKRLIEDKMSKSNLPQTERFALIIKAWNFYRLNKSIKTLRWDKNRENFPNLI